MRERFGGVPGDGLAFVDREVAERFDEVALAGPGRSADANISWRSIHSSVLSACWVWAGIAERSVPGVERLAGRQPGGAASRLDGRPVAAGGLLGEQHAQHFGVVPALAVAVAITSGAALRT